MIIPSNELLSAVFGTDVVESYEELGDINFTERRKGYFAEGVINIYELMHMIKIWAIERKYMIQSEYEGADYSIVRVFFGGELVWCNYDKHNEFYDYEPDVVILSAEWILKNV